MNSCVILRQKMPRDKTKTNYMIVNIQEGV